MDEKIIGYWTLPPLLDIYIYSYHMDMCPIPYELILLKMKEKDKIFHRPSTHVIYTIYLASTIE